MLYQLEHGGTDPTVAQAFLARGLALPDRIANAPEVPEALALFVLAFEELRSECADDQQPIKRRDIREWCADHDLDGEACETMLHHIPTIDAAWRDWQRERGAARRKDADHAKRGLGNGERLRKSSA